MPRPGLLAMAASTAGRDPRLALEAVNPYRPGVGRHREERGGSPSATPGTWRRCPRPFPLEPGGTGRPGLLRGVMDFAPLPGCLRTSGCRRPCCCWPPCGPVPQGNPRLAAGPAGALYNLGTMLLLCGNDARFSSLPWPWPCPRCWSCARGGPAPIPRPRPHYCRRSVMTLMLTPQMLLTVCPLVMLAALWTPSPEAGVDLPARLLPGRAAPGLGLGHQQAGGGMGYLAGSRYGRAGRIDGAMAWPAAARAFVQRPGALLMRQLPRSWCALVMGCIPVAAFSPCGAGKKRQPAGPVPGGARLLVFAIGCAVGFYDGLIGPGTGTFDFAVHAALWQRGGASQRHRQGVICPATWRPWAAC